MTLYLNEYELYLDWDWLVQNNEIFFITHCLHFLVVDIEDITDVRKGWKTDTFNKLGTRVQKQTVRHPGKRPLVEEQSCFSIVFGKPQKTLDLVAANEALRDAWVQGLHQVVAQNRSIEYKHSYELYPFIFNFIELLFL